MKNIALIIVFLFIKSVGNAQPVSSSSIADSVKTKSLSFLADSVIISKQVIIPQLINEVKTLTLSDYFIVYRKSFEEGWKIETNPANYASILDNTNWIRASIGIGGISVQNIQYPDKKRVLVLFK